MKNVLLPIDGSDNSRQAVEYVVDYLKLIPAAHRPKLHVLNVQMALSPNFDMLVRESDRVRHYQEQGASVIEKAAVILDGAQVSYEPHIVVTDDIARGIIDYASQSGADLVVMGTRGLGKIQGIVMGSMATKVVQLSPVPVLLVK